MDADLSILDALGVRYRAAEPDWQWCLQDDEFPDAHTRPVGRAPEPAPNLRDVLIIGGLFQELVGKTDMTKTEFSEALRHGEFDSVLRQHTVLQRAPVGGFVVRAARVARTLSYRVQPACVVPFPLPRSFATFLRDIEADTRYVVSQPGPSPVRYHIRCRDGTVLLDRPGVHRPVTPRVPRRALERLHAVLVDPAERSERGRVLSLLAGVVRPSRRRAAVAITGNADWRWEDLQAVRDCGGWLFFNARELIRTARRSTPAHSKVQPRPCPCVLRKRLGCCRLVASLGACLRDSVGMCRVVTGLGACGAALFNGDGPLKYFPTAPLIRRRAKGAGDILMVVTALSSAGGASDERSVRRGVRAATGCVAGLPLPLTLDELDV